LRIPDGAVSCRLAAPYRPGFAERHGLHLYTPIIVKYRDEKTDASGRPREALR